MAENKSSSNVQQIADAIQATRNAGLPISNSRALDILEWGTQTEPGRVLLTAANDFNNSYVNPIGLAVRGIDWLRGNNNSFPKEAIEPQTTTGRIAAKGIQYAAETPARIIGMGILGNAGKATGLLSGTKLGRNIGGWLIPKSMPVEMASGAAGGALVGALNPENKLLEIPTGIVGRNITKSLIGLGSKLISR